MKANRLRLIYAFALLLAGCHHAQPAAPMPAIQSPPSTAPKDANASGSNFFHVDVFRIEAPFGTFSGNETFWKTIDEQCVDPATADLLQRNGVRVGVAALTEMKQFSKLTENVLPTEKLAVGSGKVEQTRITMRDKIVEENIFHFTKQGDLVGQTYKQCENAIEVSFEPAPRKPGFLRLTLSPVVRALVKRLEFTDMNREFELQYVNPETMYDLRLSVDIPTGSFLIVTPSADADRPTSVGKTFFLRDGGADRIEEALLIVPAQFQVNEGSTVQIRDLRRDK